jgi:rhodanese-related sulfurtransferase
MNFIKSVKKIHIEYFMVALGLVVLGGLITLSFETLRYTKYVTPSTREMDPAVAYSIMSKQSPDEYLFFDVRTEGEYNKIHAELSKSVPIANLYSEWKTLPRDKDKKIYLICTTGRLAGVAYGFLQLHGFTNIVHVRGGIQNWVDADLPTVSRPVFYDALNSLDIPVKEKK